MSAFDTDVLSLIFKCDQLIVERLKNLSADRQAVPIVVIEEILRGRLDAIRQAQANRIRLKVDRAYELLDESLRDIRRYRVLQFTEAAQARFDG